MRTLTPTEQRIKFLLLIPVATVLVAAVAFLSWSPSSAHAGKYKVFVLTKSKGVDRCMVAPDKLSMKIQFSAKVTGAPKPKIVSISYSVTNDTTGEAVASESLTLRKPKYKKTGKAIEFLAGNTYTIKTKMNYKVPRFPRVRASGSETFPVGSAEELATLGIPACAAPA